MTRGGGCCIKNNAARADRFVTLLGVVRIGCVTLSDLLSSHTHRYGNELECPSRCLHVMANSFCEPKPRPPHF